MKTRTWAAALIAIALALAACSPSVEESTEDLCDSLASLQSTVDEIAGADVSMDTTTIDDVQNALDELQSGVESVQNAEEGVSDAVRSELQDAYDEYTSAIQDISGDSTLAEAGQSVVDAQANLEQAWTDTLSELNC